MSNTEQEKQAQAGLTVENAMAERLRKAKDLTSMTVTGARSTVSSTAEMAASEATATADAATSATQSVADSLGHAVSGAVQGAARSTGAVAGGVKGAAGGLILAAQISGGAAVEAAKNLAGSSVKATGGLAEGFLVATSDQAQGADGQHTGEPSGVIRAFDAVTGKFAWAWDIDRPGEHGEPDGDERQPLLRDVVVAALQLHELRLAVRSPVGRAEEHQHGERVG